MSEHANDGGWAAVLVPSLVAALIGGIAGWYAGGSAQSDAGSAMQSGRVIVMDTAGWVDQAAESDVSDEEIEAQFSTIEETATALRAQGYIVLYPEAVMEVPTARRIGPAEAERILQ